MKPCLRCGRSLDAAAFERTPYRAEPTYQLSCACGLVYSVELVEQTGHDRWMAIFREDGYRIHDSGGDTLEVERVGAL